MYPPELAPVAGGGFFFEKGPPRPASAPGVASFGIGLAGLEKRGSMVKGWKFVGEFKRGRKECLAIKCIVAVPDLKEAKAIASKKLIGADEITATELSRAQIKALYLKEGDVRLTSPKCP